MENPKLLYLTKKKKIIGDIGHHLLKDIPLHDVQTYIFHPKFFQLQSVEEWRSPIPQELHTGIICVEPFR